MAYDGLQITVSDQGSPSVGYVAVTTVSGGVTTPGEAPSATIYGDGGSPNTPIDFVKITVDTTNNIITGIQSNGTRVIFEPNIDVSIALSTS